VIASSGGTLVSVLLNESAPFSPDCDSDGIPDECATDCNSNGVPDTCDISSGGSADVNSNGVPDDCEMIVAANPPTDNPFVSGQQPFRDVLQTGPTPVSLQGIGSCLTPSEGAVNYCAVSVTFNVPIPLTPSSVGVACSYTGAPAGSTPCPTVTEVAGQGAGPYLISLSGPIPPGGCATLTFANAVPGQALRYEYLPGDVSMDGFASTSDLLALVQGLQSSVANLPANLARYDVNRSGIVNTADLLRLVQLLNGVNTTQAWNGATVVPCQP
jgi:hypothetical protein